MRIAIAALLVPMAVVGSALPAAEPRSPILLSEFVDAAAPYPQAHASTLVQLPDGTLAAAWFAGSGESRPDVRIWFARREAKGWTPPVPVADGIVPGGQRYPTWNPVLFQPPGQPLDGIAHQYPINLFNERGVLGVAAIVALWWSTWRRNRDASRSGLAGGAVLRHGATAALVAIVVHGLVDNSYFVLDLAYATWATVLIHREASARGSE